MFDEESNLEYDNVDVSTENDMLVFVYRMGDKPVFRTRVNKENRGKLLWAAWKMHRKALKWRNIPSLTIEGDGSTRGTE
ncbi:hypothetical protein KNU49_gp076 [Streptomyces phage EGole]|uniref:Uncharacterized protein n=1 Tax=Streptomyces phage EGole TaxID=2517973 RepID=A0A482JED1_9CAUD|nr:hypothetical protein KNU49_gp076 [Streptomyces phage EGole]QBP30978.1 hypothetical protein SEA_EGOLE_238 [Streptomyces phage EGole]